MMRKFMLISLLLLLILNDHQAHGIRLIERFLSAKQEYSHVHEEKSDLTRRNNVGIKETPAIAGQEDHGSESGSNRKLMTKTSSTSSSTSSTTTSKNDKNDHEENNKAEPTVQKGQSSSERSVGGKEENFTVNSSTVAQPPPENSAPEHYPDVLDIAEMDYSPARRKPPIHN